MKSVILEIEPKTIVDVRAVSASESDTPLIRELLRGLAEYNAGCGYETLSAEQRRGLLPEGPSGANTDSGRTNANAKYLRVVGRDSHQQTRGNIAAR